jgi:DNA-binding HxlR family transcriptional regulator
MAVELEERLRIMPDVFSVNCPTREILDLISDKWSTLIITLLHESPKRFSELQRRIEGISQKMLTQNLRNLERSGLVTRTVYPQVPPKVEYNLTELGETLYEPISAVQRWAETYILDVQSAQHDYDHRVQYVTK